MLEKYMQEEFDQLSLKYGGNPQTKKNVLYFEDKRFFNNFSDTITKNRRGEVGFLLQRKNGKFVLVRSKKYPADVLRIPTGGIEFNETAEEALYREVKEELGVSFDIKAFEGLIEYEIHLEHEVIKFYSFLFLIKETGGEILKDATENEISGIRECDEKDLKAAELFLKNNGGNWKDWCEFRSRLLEFHNEVNHILEG